VSWTEWWNARTSAEIALQGRMLACLYPGRIASSVEFGRTEPIHFHSRADGAHETIREGSFEAAATATATNGFGEMSSLASRRIVLMAEFEKGQLGGGESVVLGLVRGLFELVSPAEKYIVLTSKSMAASIREFLVPPHEVLSRPSGTCDGHLLKLRRSISIRFPRVASALRRVTNRKPQGLPEKIEELDPFVMGLDPHLIHYLYPLHFARGSIPSVYTVHDQNYEHMPELFDRDYIRWRRTLMDAVTAEASAIIAISYFVAEDVSRLYPDAGNKIHVVKWAPYISIVDEERSRPLQNLPERFVLYPAGAYPHKNHINLIRALSLVNQRLTSRIDLVLTGAKTEYWKVIEPEVRAVSEYYKVVHLGYVSEEMLSTAYEEAALIAFPSLFEGAGLPLIEAITMRKPVCCSNIPPFREYGRDYPCFFDPEDVSSIATAIYNSLVCRAAPKIAPPQSTWASVAAAHRAIYRGILEK
jgi:glycosyltransferase involved in cell wall biosynthesis